MKVEMFVLKLTFSYRNEKIMSAPSGYNRNVISLVAIIEASSNIKSSLEKMQNNLFLPSIAAHILVSHYL
jgi:hypothetical protein